jgi:hypothetical protein
MYSPTPVLACFLIVEPMEAAGLHTVQQALFSLTSSMSLSPTLTQLGVAVLRQAAPPRDTTGMGGDQQAAGELAVGPVPSSSMPCQQDRVRLCPPRLYRPAHQHTAGPGSQPSTAAMSAAAHSLCSNPSSMDRVVPQAITHQRCMAGGCRCYWSPPPPSTSVTPMLPWRSCSPALAQTTCCTTISQLHPAEQWVRRPEGWGMRVGRGKASYQLLRGQHPVRHSVVPHVRSLPSATQDPAVCCTPPTGYQRGP